MLDWFAYRRAMMLTLLALPLPGAPLARATTFAVDDVTDAVDAVPGDGLCASASGTCTLRAAVMETNAGPGADEVVLPAGLYRLTTSSPCEDASLGSDLDVTDDLMVVGAGAADTVIAMAASEENVLEVHAGAHVTLSDLTITGGFLYDCFPVGGAGLRNAGITELEGVVVSGNGAFVAGGGIENLGGGELYVRASLVETNGAHGLGDDVVSRGGGIDNHGFATLEGSAVVDNGAAEGGGIWNNGTLHVLGSEIRDNSAGTGSVGSAGGGGILNYGTLHVADSLIEGNATLANIACQMPFPCAWVGGVGAGIAVHRGKAQIERTLLESNRGEGDGGAVYARGQPDMPPVTVTLVDSTVSGNAADAEVSGELARGGGVFASGTVTVEIEGSTVSANTSQGFGGGVALSDATLTARNATLSGNDAQEAGGAIHAQGASASLHHVTLAQNTAGGDGSSVHHSGGALTWTNSLLSGTCAGGGTAVTAGGNVESPGDTCGLTGASDQVGVADAGLAPLSAIGGATPTHALLVGSPAREAVPPDGSCALLDQRDIPRPQGPRCDAGAVEAVVAGCASVGGLTAELDRLPALLAPLVWAARRRIGRR